MWACQLRMPLGLLWSVTFVLMPYTEGIVCWTVGEGAFNTFLPQGSIRESPDALELLSCRRTKGPSQE